MKISAKNTVKKLKNKNKSVLKPKKEHVVVVAQEIKFARLLAGNEKKTRDRALKTLKKWLQGCFQREYEFKEDDFARIWKGLFYAVWMSDKPLIQEELCENIAGILDLFPPEQYKYALLMTRVGFKTLATEWYGLDQHRMDKCLMLVRRYLRSSLRCVARSKWTESACKAYAKMLSGRDGLFALKTQLYARNATSMLLHIIDCYLEEIAKVSEGDISPQSLSVLLRPFCLYLCGGECHTLVLAARGLLTALLRQSDEQARYQMRTKAWEQMGCPEGGPEALVSDDEDDEHNDEESDQEEDRLENPLDPRAGRVDVLLPRLPVPCKEIASILRGLLKNTTSKAHKRVKICLQRFERLSRSQPPLPVQTPAAEAPEPRARRSAAAAGLRALEKALISSSDELALRGLSRKHRKRLLAKRRAGLSIIEDAAHIKTSSKNAAGDCYVEETNTQANTKTNEKDSNKENVVKNKKRKLEKETTDIRTKKLKPDTKEIKSVEKKTKIKIKNKSTAIIQSLHMSDMKQNKTKSKKVINTNGVSEVPVKTTTQTKTDSNKSTIIKTTKPEKKTEIETSKSKQTIKEKQLTKKPDTNPRVVAKKVKKFQKQLSPKIDKNNSVHTPKKVKFVLKNNSMQGTMDYYKSVRQSPNIPFDSSKQPTKTNLKVSTPSPINPFFKKKFKLRI